jgi:hypothetical protein
LPEGSTLTIQISEYLRKNNTRERMQSLVEKGRLLIGVYQNLRDPHISNKQRAERAQVLADMLQSCDERASGFLDSLDNIDETESNIFLTLQDQLLILFLILFSVYERFYDFILSRMLHVYLIKCNLIPETLALPQVFDETLLPLTIEEGLRTQGKPVLGRYEFPVVLRLLMASSKEMREIFARCLSLEPKEQQTRALGLGDNLIHSMIIRNRIAHMSEIVGYYSPKNQKQNLQYLAAFFPLVLENLHELLSLFSNLHSEALSMPPSQHTTS